MSRPKRARGAAGRSARGSSSSAAPLRAALERKSARSDGRRPPRALLVGLLLAMAVVAAGLFISRPWRRSSSSSAGRAAPAIPDSIARLGPDAAYARAIGLVKAHRPFESLPYFRQALSYPGEPMQAHLDYSTGLNDAAIQSRVRYGLPGPASRSSIERIALMREALAQVTQAERMASTPAERAYVHATFAHHFVTWGMPWEALREFREAQLADPSSSWAVIADILAARLHHPERPDPDTEPSAALASLLRDALVFDDGDTVRLTLGARTRWWAGGHVQRAPTFWGRLDLDFFRRGDTTEWRCSAAPVWTALTLPPGTRLAGGPPAPLLRGDSDRVVLAPPGARQAVVRLTGGTP